LIFLADHFADPARVFSESTCLVKMNRGVWTGLAHSAGGGESGLRQDLPYQRPPLVRMAGTWVTFWRLYPRQQRPQTRFATSTCGVAGTVGRQGRNSRSQQTASARLQFCRCGLQL